jgi:hypothetical protein
LSRDFKRTLCSTGASHVSATIRNTNTNNTITNAMLKFVPLWVLFLTQKTKQHLEVEWRVKEAKVVIFLKLGYRNIQKKLYFDWDRGFGIALSARKKGKRKQLNKEKERNRTEQRE